MCTIQKLERKLAALHRREEAEFSCILFSLDMVNCSMEDADGGPPIVYAITFI